jgi:hypothetical protein
VIRVLAASMSPSLAALPSGVMWKYAQPLCEVNSPRNRRKTRMDEDIVFEGDCLLISIINLSTDKDYLAFASVY